MSNAARKARKKSGEKFEPKPQKVATVRYLANGRAVHHVPPMYSSADIEKMMEMGQNMWDRLAAQAKQHQFPN